MYTDPSPNIPVIIVSKDPYFLFTVRALLGREKRIRISSIVSSITELGPIFVNEITPKKTKVLVCDLDTVESISVFYEELTAFFKSNPNTKVICLSEGLLKEAATHGNLPPISALLAKSDIGICLHLAIFAVVINDLILLTPKSKKYLRTDSVLYNIGKVINPGENHPELNLHLVEIAELRIFIGLDNKDIQDELVLENISVRKYISQIYERLGVKNEIEAFEQLSAWWWKTRFEGLLD